MKYLKYIKYLLVFVLAFILAVQVFEQDESFYESVYIEKVVDGDTVRTTTGEKIRIIGINTPEISKKEVLSKEARDYAEKILIGKRVYLEEDEDLEDKYGRSLRYIWIEIPEKLDYESVLNYNFSGIMLREGLARTYTFKPNVKYKDFFDIIQEDAKKEKKGMWKYSKDGTTRGDKGET